MENFDQQIPIITERKKAELDSSEERMRRLLANEIDMTAETLQEYYHPNYQTLQNKSFQVFTDQYYRGSFDCRYENGQMQHATINLKARENHFDATLSYDQERELWLLYSLDFEEPKHILTLDIMRSIITPPHYTKKMVYNEPDSFKFNDLIELFAKKSTGFVDKRAYITASLDGSGSSGDDSGEIITMLEISKSRNNDKNYRSLEVIHQNVDSSNTENPDITISKSYKMVTGKENISYIGKNMSADEASTYLERLKTGRKIPNL